MDKTYPLSSLMVVCSLNMNNDPFSPCENCEKLFGLKVPYLSVVGALMYHANHTCQNIAFLVNLSARYNSVPTRKHWNEIKHIYYLRGTTDMVLFYSNE